MIDSIGMLSFAVGGLVAALGYFATVLISHRRFYRDLPGPPHSMLWGHLKTLDQYLQKMPPTSYMQAALTQMKLDFDLPDIFYLDLWPAGPCFVICSSPDSAAISTTRNVFQQADVVFDFFDKTIGSNFIGGLNGPLWRDLHHALAPGLSQLAVRKHHRLIIDEAKLFHDRLKQFAKSGETFELASELGKFPFEVVGNIFFGENLGTQTRDAQMFKDMQQFIQLQGFLNNSMHPLKNWQAKRERQRCMGRLQNDIETLVHSRFKTLQQLKELPSPATSCILDRMLLSRVESGKPMDNHLLKLIVDNAKGMLTAGYGTTTDISSYLFMLLGAFPEVLNTLRKEHDRVFDTDFYKTIQTLYDNPGLINNLEYTTAVIRETMRLFPVGVSVRQPPPDMTVLEYKGNVYPVKGHIFGILSHSLHYSSEVFENPKQFKPERFLGADPASSRDGYRPFERGVRACIGQNLAMEEMKVLLVMTARWFDFELRDHDPVTEPRMTHTDMDTKLGIHAYQCWSVTVGPHGPVNMKIHVAKETG